MIDNIKILRLIDAALYETDNVVSNSGYLTDTHEVIIRTKLVLKLLKKEVLKNPEKINNRVLRGMQTLGMYSFKEFENTPLEEAIIAVGDVLYYGIPSYKELEHLDTDFGNGDPI